jgi:hypothetical protein
MSWVRLPFCLVAAARAVGEIIPEEGTEKKMTTDR